MLNCSNMFQTCDLHKGRDSYAMCFYIYLTIFLFSPCIILLPQAGPSPPIRFQSINASSFLPMLSFPQLYVHLHSRIQSFHPLTPPPPTVEHKSKLTNRSFNVIFQSLIFVLCHVKTRVYSVAPTQSESKHFHLSWIVKQSFKPREMYEIFKISKLTFIQ